MFVSDIGETLQRIETGQAAEVIPLLEHLVRHYPAGPTAHVLLARAYEAEGGLEQALRTWQWAAMLMPNSPVICAGVERCVRALAGVSPVVGLDAADAAGAPRPASIPLVPPPEVGEFVDLTEQTGLLPAPARTPARGPGAIPEAGAPEEFEDLDRLIAELESARITPDPDFASVPAPDLEDEIDDMVSETLARIYAAQRQYDEAARVFELLAAQQPERSREFMTKATEMRNLADEE